jgi:hypothetical protein
VSEASEVSRVWGAVTRRWPVVLVCVLVGAAAFAFWGVSRAPETGYTATARVRVADTGVPNMPTMDSVTAYAGSSRMKAAVVASAGLEAKGVTVNAAQDSKDKRSVVITAKAAESDTAIDWANAAAEQTRANSLEMIAAPIGLEEARIGRLEARTEQLRKEIAVTRALALKATDPQVQSNYVVSAQTLEDSLNTALDDLDQARFALQGYKSWVAITPALAASKTSAQGVVLSDLLRGGLVGLFVGVLIAALLENRKSGAASATR